MKKFNFSRLFAAALFVAVLALSGCKQITYVPVDNYVIVTPVETGDGIIGTWTSTYSEVFAITTTTLSNSYNGSVCYAGDNIAIVKDDETSGRIFIKYTQAFNTADVGKWYALSYKNLGTSSVKISGAYKTGGKTSCNKLAEAAKEFTIANGYFATYSDCTK